MKLDINAMELKITNLTKKIENAELYINEIEKHKKSIFEFWKFTNKDEISTLTQGMFVGAVSDNFEERIEQKIFHAEIVVDNDAVVVETKAYQQIPQILSFVDEQGEDRMKQEIETNYKQIKMDIVQIIEMELERIKNDPDLQHLVQE